jgi:hypothetical protein
VIEADNAKDEDGNTTGPVPCSEFWEEQLSKDFEQRFKKCKDSEQRLKKSKDLNP